MLFVLVDKRVMDMKKKSVTQVSDLIRQNVSTNLHPHPFYQPTRL